MLYLVVHPISIRMPDIHYIHTYLLDSKRNICLLRISFKLNFLYQPLYSTLKIRKLTNILENQRVNGLNSNHSE